MDVWGVQIIANVEDVIEHVRQELANQNINLLKDIKPTFNNIMVTCISHGDGQERNPSLGISITEQKDYTGEKIPAGTCHCFTCGYRADLPTFVSNAFGYNDRGMFGYKWIIRNYASIAIEERKQIQLNMSREQKSDNIEEEIEIKEEQLDQYRYLHPYMEKRKLNEKVISYFDIGYDRQVQAITFPVFDLDGKVRLIQRRSVNGRMFINDEGGSKGEFVYGLYQVKLNLEWVDEVYITESPIDALTLWKHRIPAVALMGARATMRQIQLLKEFPVRKYVLALDNDEAGHRGAEFIKNNLRSNKVLFKMQFPEGTNDVNDLSDEQIKTIKKDIFY